MKSGVAARAGPSATFITKCAVFALVKDIAATERDGFKVNGHHYFTHLAQCLAGNEGENMMQSYAAAAEAAAGLVGEASASGGRRQSLSAYQENEGKSRGGVLGGTSPLCWFA